MTEEQIKRVFETKESLFNLLNKKLGVKGNWDIKRFGDTLKLQGSCYSLSILPDWLNMVISGCEFSAKIKWNKYDENYEYSPHIEVGPVVIELMGWGLDHSSGFFCPSICELYLFYLPDEKSEWEMRVLFKDW